MQPELLDSAKVAALGRTRSVTRLVFLYTLIALTLAVGAVVIVEILDQQDRQRIIDEGGPLYRTTTSEIAHQANPLAIVLDPRWLSIWIFGCTATVAGSLLSRARICDL